MKNNLYHQNIYLDGSATSPPRKEVIQRINEIDINYWANPSSLHSYGIKAAEILERSRKSIGQSLGAECNEIFFTSGATESIHLAIQGAAKKIKPGRIVISNVEHPSVQSAAKMLIKEGWQIEYWPVDLYGQVQMSRLDDLLSYPTKIVSIVWGQSEVGSIQPIEDIGRECKTRGIIFHTDATQILSQFKFQWNALPVDLLSASSHKFCGPKGVGFLLVKADTYKSFTPLYGGGGQENGLRSGTQPVSLIAGMALAIELLNSPLIDNDSPLNCLGEYKKVEEYTFRLRNRLKNFDNLEFTGHPKLRLANHISMLVGNKNNEPLSGRTIVRELSKNGIYASSETACKSGIISYSETLKAMGIPLDWCKSGLRFSLGPWLSDGDIESVPDILQECITSLN
ncbi:cysteine desulfurase family protein [Prochlorococcus sp. MIT 1307]|uniref:cysteine desulfurase family protein n=1 Tax=Prochlorococcus sp. MIT 1307 TaxID=3096219 RepID=UPI002A76370D|nr:cysteine desulfurase family protein [Prochlorococcus sp. MIT 1307]